MTKRGQEAVDDLCLSVKRLRTAVSVSENPGVAAAAALLDGQQPLHKPALGGAGYYPQQQHCPAGGQQPLQPSHLNGGPADGGGRQGVQVSLHGAFEAAAAGQEWCYEQNNLMLRQLHMEWLQRRGGLG